MKCVEQLVWLFDFQLFISFLMAAYPVFGRFGSAIRLRPNPVELIALELQWVPLGQVATDSLRFANIVFKLFNTRAATWFKWTQENGLLGELLTILILTRNKPPVYSRIDWTKKLSLRQTILLQFSTFFANKWDCRLTVQ